MTRLYLFLVAIVVTAGAALLFVPLALAQFGDSTDSTSDLAAWASITGILLPIGIAIVARHNWTAQAKMIFAVAVAVVDGVVVTGLTDGWNPSGHMLVTVAGVLALSQVTYRNVWLKLGDTSTPTTPTSSDPVITKLSRATG